MKPKKKMEFSKILVVLITVYFFATLTMAVAFWMITGRIIPTEFLWAIGGPFTSVTGFYLIKSGWAQSSLNSSHNYIPYYNERSPNMGNYNMPTYNTPYSSTMYRQGAPYQYNQPAQY